MDKENYLKLIVKLDRSFSPSQKLQRNTHQKLISQQEKDIKKPADNCDANSKLIKEFRHRH
jgi:hypothetical protein